MSAHDYPEAVAIPVESARAIALEFGCGLYFCWKHTKTAGAARAHADLCTRCYHGRRPYAPTPDVPEWMRHKLRDASWWAWRAENPDVVAEIRVALAARAGTAGACPC